jgi:hypothetical protein
VEEEQETSLKKTILEDLEWCHRSKLVKIHLRGSLINHMLLDGLEAVKDHVKTALAGCSLFVLLIFLCMLLVMGCIWLGVSGKLVWSSLLVICRLRSRE